MVIHTAYNFIKEQIQPGDIIAFGGDTLFSHWVKFTTRSPVTHVAMVLKTPLPNSDTDCACSLVMESTVSKQHRGVMINKLCKRVKDYEGDIWWLPLSNEARATFVQNQQKFTEFMLAQQNKSYDYFQLFGASIDRYDNHPVLGRITYNEEDISRWFCSELVASGLGVAGIINAVNVSEVTPIDICQFTIYQQRYLQIKGERKPITGFNQLAPTNWGQIT